ncbi:MAG TPA: (d)CMP kinase [Ilumatobacteraceae bacterium]|nr:(d)CMP kinase [Ilumatobacteraceae bacterium]
MRVIAIDGPAGAGKSTVARALAEMLGLDYLDTGAMYRAITFAAMERNLCLDDAAAVGSLARSVALEVGESGVIVDGFDATTAIRTAAVTAAISKVAANSEVRTEMRARQQQWAADHGGGVIEGRDIGSVVFPDAELKLYLTASPRTRAQRRVAQSGGDVDEIEASIAARDHYDSTRADSPLTFADGSIVVDTTGSRIDQVLAHIAELMSRGSGQQ